MDLSSNTPVTGEGKAEEEDGREPEVRTCVQDAQVEWFRIRIALSSNLALFDVVLDRTDDGLFSGVILLSVAASFSYSREQHVMVDRARR